MQLLDNLNWRMTLFFLLALLLLGFVMKLVVLLVPSASNGPRSFMFWLLPSSASLRPAPTITDNWRLYLRATLWVGVVSIGYWTYWKFVSALHVRGVVLSYLAVPILLFVGEMTVAVLSVLFLAGGRPLPPLLERPWAVRSVAEFWGRRWNLWFSDWFRRVIFRPLHREPVVALLLVFAVSGLMHEWVVNLPLYCLTRKTLFGSMMVYFLLQPVGILFERYFFKRRPMLRRLFAWFVVIIPAPLLFNEGLLRAMHLWPE
jgi:hypothetical protein